MVGLAADCWLPAALPGELVVVVESAFAGAVTAAPLALARRRASAAAALPSDCANPGLGERDKRTATLKAAVTQLRVVMECAPPIVVAGPTISARAPDQPRTLSQVASATSAGELVGIIRRTPARVRARRHLGV